jgi:hypothetical protein
MPISDGAFRAIDHSEPSRKATTSSPPRLVHRRDESELGPSVEVSGGEGASVTEPGGGRTGTLVAALMGGRD